MNRQLRRFFVLSTMAVCAIGTSCKDSSSTSEPKPTQPAVAPGATTASKLTTEVLVSIDGNDPVAVSVAGSTTPTALSELLGDHVPAFDTCYEIRVHYKKHRLTVALDSYRDYRLLAYRDAKGALRTGLYPPGTGTSVRPMQEVVGLDRIEVWTEEPPAKGVEPLPITIRDTVVVLDATTLASLATVPWRSDGRRKSKVGWSLAVLVSEAQPDLAEYSAVLEGAKDSRQTVSGNALASVVVRRAARGGFQAKLVGSNGKSTWRVKGLHTIRVTPAQ